MDMTRRKAAASTRFRIWVALVESVRDSLPEIGGVIIAQKREQLSGSRWFRTCYQMRCWGALKMVVGEKESVVAATREFQASQKAKIDCPDHVVQVFRCTGAMQLEGSVFMCGYMMVVGQHVDVSESPECFPCLAPSSCCGLESWRCTSSKCGEGWRSLISGLISCRLEMRKRMG